MEREQFINSKLDELFIYMPKWAIMAEKSPFTMIMEIKNFLNSIYDEGQNQKLKPISAKDIEKILNRDKERQQ